VRVYDECRTPLSGHQPSEQDNQLGPRIHLSAATIYIHLLLLFGSKVYTYLISAGAIEAWRHVPPVHFCTRKLRASMVVSKSRKHV